MPPKTQKGREEAKEVALFVRKLYTESGFRSWGEFARTAGVAPATMSDWQRAENAPSGYSLLKLIAAANWSANGAASPPDRLAAIEEKADAALVGIADILDLLRGAQRESESPAPRASPR